MKFLSRVNKAAANLYEQGKSIGAQVRSGHVTAAAAAGSMAVGTAHAALDTTGVTTAMADAKTDALAVGVIVIGFVAGIVVVGIIIGMIKRA